VKKPFSKEVRDRTISIMSIDNLGALLSTGPAARFLEVSPETLRKYWRTRQVQAIQTTTGALLFRKADLQAFAETRKRTRSTAA